MNACLCAFLCVHLRDFESIQCLGQQKKKFYKEKHANTHFILSKCFVIWYEMRFHVLFCFFVFIQEILNQSSARFNKRRHYTKLNIQINTITLVKFECFRLLIHHSKQFQKTVNTSKEIENHMNMYSISFSCFAVRVHVLFFLFICGHFKILSSSCNNFLLQNSHSLQVAILKSD